MARSRDTGGRFPDNFVERARVAQVIAVYLGASWIVLQIAELLVDALALPPWVREAREKLGPEVGQPAPGQ